jgi:hypothetical protein
MRRKIIAIILVIVMYLTNISLYNYDKNASAESGLGDEESIGNSIAVENDFV